MIRLAICDDNKSFLDFIHQALRKWIRYHGINIDILMFENGEDLLYSIEENGNFQVVLIEIELKRVDGLTIATKINRRCSSTIIMFISSLEYCHKRVYNVHPFYFFTKPLRYNELSSIMKRVIKRLDIDYQTFCFCHKNCHYWVPVREIIYFYSDGRKIGVVCTHKRHFFYGKLDSVNEEMKGKANIFLRIHKSYLVNLRYITLYQSNCIEVAGKENLPISRSRMNVIKNVLHKERK